MGARRMGCKSDNAGEKPRAPAAFYMPAPAAQAHMHRHRHRPGTPAALQTSLQVCKHTIIATKLL